MNGYLGKYSRTKNRLSGRHFGGRWFKYAGWFGEKGAVKATQKTYKEEGKLTRITRPRTRRGGYELWVF